MSLLDEFTQLKAEALAAFSAASDAQILEQVRVAYLGKKGKLKTIMGRMGEIDKAERPLVGAAAKDTEAGIREAFEATKVRIESQSPSDLSSEEQLRLERLNKLKKLEAAVGVEAAWGARFADITPIEDVRARFPDAPPDGTDDDQPSFGSARIAARVMLRRDQSKKLIFLTVQDQGGTIQVALWNQLLNDEKLDLIRDALDLWDLVGVTGELRYTRTGEQTIWATDIQILTKCIAPPPEKHHGIADKEIRYRQRYLDLISNPDSRKTFILRSKAISQVRRYLDDHGFLEMETPTLQLIPGGAAARPFETHLNALSIKMYLRIATEVPLKKLLVGGLERVYEMGRIFRNEGIDYNHNPEFTTVEIYQAYGDLTDMMRITEDVVCGLARTLTGSTTITWRGQEIKLATPWPRLDYGELLRTHAGVSYEDEAGMKAKLKAKDVDPEGFTRVDLIDATFSEYCEPHLRDACFIINQPIEMSPLCKAHPEHPKLAHRFEAFAASMEIANAYSELNNPLEQKQRLLDQQRDTWRRFLVECDDAQAGTIPATLQARIRELVKKAQSESDWAPESDDEGIAVLDEIMALCGTWKKPEYYREQVLKLKDPSLLIDDDFICALEHGMPPAGGLGIGIDRVVMLLAGVDSIRDVILFPLMRPEQIK